jgi:hypothetical protein
MNRRKLLALLTGLTVLSGLIFAAIPFVGSMNPNEVAKSNARVRVEISEIPEVGALEVDYQWYKALIVKNPEMAVFLMPYNKGAYQLPDPTWERPIVPCNNFIISAQGFACEDTKLHESWGEQARWDLKGRSKGTWMPDLQKTNFKLQGKYLILSPEYN